MNYLLKQTGETNGNRYWKYSVNGHAFGLTFNPSNYLAVRDNQYYLAVRGLEYLFCGTFRQGICQLLGEVRKYYR